MKSRHRLLFWTVCFLNGGGANALDLFECVRGLLPITEAAGRMGQRTGVEQPFWLDGKYLVFPEVKSEKVTGFYVYRGPEAWYFDRVTPMLSDQPEQQLSALSDANKQIYKLVGRSSGDETVTLQYMPGFQGEEPAASSSLFSSRAKRHKAVYHDPSEMKESVPRALMRMKGPDGMDKAALMGPLERELKLRQVWIREHNLNEESFRTLTHLMKGVCR